jgi:hypothetical protein
MAFYLVQCNAGLRKELAKLDKPRTIVEPVSDDLLLYRVLGLPKSEGLQIEKIHVPELRFTNTVSIQFLDFNGVMPSKLKQGRWEYSPNDLMSAVSTPPPRWAAGIVWEGEDYYQRWMPIRLMRHVSKGIAIVEDTSVSVTLTKLQGDGIENKWCVFFESTLVSKEWHEICCTENN